MTEFRLPRLVRGFRLVDANGAPTRGFSLWWQRLVEKIEEALTSVLTALATMDDIAPITIYADHAGTVQDGQLPRDVQARRYNNTTDVTTSSAWSFTVDSGGITATIGAATGILNITALTSSASVTITSVYLGITKSRLLTVTKSVAPPPSGSGGGTSASDSSFSSFNTSSMATISDTLTVTAGTAGEVQLSAPLTVSTTSTADGTYETYLIWQWDDGGAWTDLGTETASDPDVVYFLGGGTDGAVAGSYTHTGRTPTTSYSYRLLARKNAAAPAGTMYLYGTASAVGS